MNFEQPRFWYLQIAGWTSFAFLSYLVFRPTSPDTNFALTRTIIFASTGFAITILFRMLYKKLLARSTHFVTLAIAAFGCSIVSGAIWIVSLEWITWILIPEYADPQILIQYGPKATFYNSFILLAWSALYFSMKNWQDLQVQKENALKATALAHEAQLHMLRYQVNPHFLFNALNSVRALIAEDPQRARSMVTQLSEFLRYTLNSRNAPEVNLRDEVDCIRNYLAIEKIRYEEKLQVEIRMEEGAESCRIPAFLIHPLIENAVKHGMRTSAIPLQISLSVQVHNGQIDIRVKNTGRRKVDSPPRIPDENGTGTGLRNVRERLQQVHPGRHRFEIAENNGWVEANIQMPIVASTDDRVCAKS